MLKHVLFSLLMVVTIASMASAQTGGATAPKPDTVAPVTTQSKADSAQKGGALYFNKEQVDQMFAAGGAFAKENNYQITAGRRTTPGQAEIHGKDTDIFYVVDGTAKIVTGGSLVDEKTTAPDEIRGASIKGGEARQLSKGDLIVIPHGTPHWIEQVEGTFQYLVVKVR